ncbi:hypothetical protein FNF29_08394 [Cafeteria roenbergensis]|uniref:Uncharacterized protein n=1 Tax=Cafeteria roenbergensis TaxID=33653 RepID=A0A5A8BYW3_CAFRO|nr:hypothetical protein FNF29_08394 [Cafeteria roenbergensis]|eukprot:KAA0145774.1 hypothetical protein FNF29_08394 [Cafeteria roenbergensis]
MAMTLTADDMGKLLLTAASSGDVAEIERLLSAGALVDWTSPMKNASTALILASMKNHAEAAELLIKHGANVNAQTTVHFRRRGWSPLMLAAGRGHAEVGSVLLNHGADMDARDVNGNPALVHCSVGASRTGPSRLSVGFVARCSVATLTKSHRAETEALRARVEHLEASLEATKEQMHAALAAKQKHMTLGVTEMATKLDDTTVQFGLANFALGSGSFKRNKLVFVHVAGREGRRRGQGPPEHAQGRGEGVHGGSSRRGAALQRDECTPEHFIEHLSKVIKVDDMGGFSISKLTADYEAMIASAGPAGVPDALERAATRKTAAEMGTVEGAKALEAVKQPLGPFNWALFKASDSLELPQRRLHVASNEMTKTSPVTASSAEEMTLDAIIDKVRRSAVVDGGAADADEDPYSLESFMKALREEAAANAEFYGESADAAADDSEHPFASTLASVHASGSGYNWMLVGKA